MADVDLAITVFAPVTLEGRYVTLEPLQASHHAALCKVGADENIFRWFPICAAGEISMRKFIDDSLSDQHSGKALPFVVRTRHDGRIVGSTRFGNIDASNRRAEIGWTWYAPSVQRTPVNTECKLLLLRHAFETLGLNRVEFKTDTL
ncbi:MAG: GNAT family N-acetyltransferase, partial [Rhodanobacteraceae bacterium]